MHLIPCHFHVFMHKKYLKPTKLVRSIYIFHVPKLYFMAKISTGMITQAIMAIVLLVVLFKLYAVLVPEAQAAGDELNDSGVPLGGLFTGNGIVFLIIMAALVFVVVKSFMGGISK